MNAISRPQLKYRNAWYLGRVLTKRRTGSAYAVLLLATAVACDHDVTVPVPEPTRAELLQSLTAEAALAVGADGKFQPVSPINTGRAQITQKQAADLAVAVAKFNYSLNAARFNEERGATVSFGRLFLCQPPLYASPAFERLEIDEASKAAHPLQKGIGPVWLVRLCAPDGPELNVAVSAYSTDLGITSDGRVDFPAIGGGDFFAQGIPALHIGDELPSAEAAVVLAASFSGQHVAAVPELITPFFRYGAPLDARWHLRLEGPAKLRTISGQLLETRDIYVSRIRAGDGSRFWIADTIQPDFVDVTYIPLTFVGEKYEDYLKRQLAEIRTLHALRLPNMPISFTPAAIEK